MILFALFIFWLMFYQIRGFNQLLPQCLFVLLLLLIHGQYYLSSGCMHTLAVLFSLRALHYIYLGGTLITIHLNKMLTNLTRSVVYAGHVD